MLHKILQWFIVSSADPERVSATLQGILLQYAAYTMAIASAFHFPLSQTQIYEWITIVCGLYGALLTLFGLGRKLYFEIKTALNPSQG